MAVWAEPQTFRLAHPKTAGQFKDVYKAKPKTVRKIQDIQAKPGTFVAHFSVDDPDSADNGRFSCFLGGLDVGGLFALRRFHHGEYALTVSGGRRMDRDRYKVTVTCADHGQPSTVSTLDMSDSVCASTRAT